MKADMAQVYDWFDQGMSVKDVVGLTHTALGNPKDERTVFRYQREWQASKASLPTLWPYSSEWVRQVASDFRYIWKDIGRNLEPAAQRDNLALSLLAIAYNQERQDQLDEQAQLANIRTITTKEPNKGNSQPKAAPWLE